MKCTYSQQNIKSFGGINFADKIVQDHKIYESIDQSLGPRGLTAKYRYSDLVRSYLLLVLCGGDCAEDITEHLAEELSQVREFEVPSADTLLRLQKELATDTETFTSLNGIQHEFCTNEVLNQLLLDLLVKTGQLSLGRAGHILDYDNQFIPTGKYDAKRGYKKSDGYFPGIASIGNMPVFIEGRNGNSQVKYKQEDTLEKVFDGLSQTNIKIGQSRMDCGSFSKKIVDVVAANSERFYIRA